MATSTSASTTPTNGALQTNIKQALNSVGEGVADVRSEVGQLATAIGDEVKARAGTMSKAAQETGSRAMEAARIQVREHPAATLGIAAGAGLLLGLLLAGRR
jgi:ElaB/YqjD/DUF883 family membrane-anchored ribosome-binding protein